MSTSPALRLALVGATGRMGRRLDALVTDASDLEVTAKVSSGGSTLEDVDASLVDAVIDFSVRALVQPTCRWCADHGVPLVLGTTGLDADDHAAVAAAAERVPVVFAPNFSVGVNVLFALAGELASLVGDGWDLEIVEAHHRHKVDAPSGTARRLLEVLAEARGVAADDALVGGRLGQVGARAGQEIGVHAVRGGSVVGDHTVHYLGVDEQIGLTHRALDRDVFVRGALRAARWAVRGPEGAPRSAGLRSMQDVLRER